MKNWKLVVAGFAALTLTAGQAMAEGEEEGDPCAGGEEGMGGDPCGGGDEGGGGAEMQATGGEETPAGEGLAGYPQAVIDRPLVLPKGMLEVAGGLSLAKITILGESATSIGLGIGARYGLAPKIDGQLTYSFSLKDFEIKGPLGVAVQYDLASSDKMWIAARVTTGLDLNGIDATDGSSKVQFEGVGLGVNFQYNVTPKIAILSPGNQLTLGGDDFPKPVAINLPVGVGFQANEKIYAFAYTSIGTIGLSPSGNVLISDITPVTVGASFSPSNKLDVGASLSFLDVQHAGDFLVVGVNAAMRM